MPTIIDNNYKPNDHSPIAEMISNPVVPSPDFKTAIVNNRNDNLHSLVQYSTGAKQQVVYFRQRLGMDDAPTHFSLAQTSPTQQYERIDGVEILVQNPYSYSQTEDYKYSEITGTAHVKPPIIPNVGDVMLMDIGRGTFAIFSINSVTRLSHRRNTLHEISYRMMHEVKDQLNDEYMLNLNRKVVEVMKWSNDFLKYGQNPLLTPERADVFEYLSTQYKRIVTWYFKTFYVKYYETLPLPNQPLITYDPFFMEFISRVFTVKDSSLLVNFRLYNLEEKKLFTTTSFWNALLNRDKYLLNESFRNAATLNVNAFTKFAKFAQIKYSGFHGVIVPGQFDYNNEIYTLQKDRVGVLNPLVVPNGSVNNPTIDKRYGDRQLVNQVYLNKGYPLSADFYLRNTEGMSHLELQVLKYFDDDLLNEDILLQLVNDIRQWGELEQYYYTPIVLCLMNYFTRKM